MKATGLMIRDMAKVKSLYLVNNFLTKENLKIIGQMALVRSMNSMVTYTKDKCTTAIDTARAN